MISEKLHPMLSPKSIAIVGASGDSQKIGYKAVTNIKRIGFQGDVHLVNPNYDSIEGYKCYKSIVELPKEIDLAMIILGAKNVLGALEQLADRNVKSILILSAGFAEIGGAGVELQNELAKFSESKNIPLCGPNTIGIANFGEKSMTSFTSLILAEPDSVAFVTQSGAIGTLAYTMAKEMGYGFEYFVDSGNEAGTDYFEFVEYFSKLEHLNVIGGYIEGASDFKKMEQAIESCHENQKPLVLLKSGKTEKGAIAASSHSASVAGNAAVFNSYFKHRNVIEVANEIELIDTITVFNKTPLQKGPGGLAVITQSGGSGIIITDRAEEKGVELPDFTEEVMDELKCSLPSFATFSNPLDITAQVSQQQDLILDSLKISIKDKNINTIILYLQMTDEAFLPILPELSELIESTEKRIIFCWSGIKEKTKQEVFKYKNICWLPSPTRAIDAVSNAMKYERKIFFRKGNSQAERVTEVDETAINGTQNEWDSKLLLQQYGVSVPKGNLITSVEEIKGLDLSYPLVMKAASVEIQHKTDLGLVKLNIANVAEAKEAYEDIQEIINKKAKEAQIDGVLVEEMVEEGIEVIIGAINDPIFGVCTVFGLGGVFVEVLKDVVILPAPITNEDAQWMIKSIKNHKILDGARGTNYDIDALADTIVRLSELSVDKRESIVELDVNPVIVHANGKGVTAVDGLIIGK